MAYQALYRTYRPQLFSEVVGQEVVVQTLQNAILSNKISHAYLFSGPRGTGKTTVARIFAKALNCTNLNGAEPCGECDSCKEISEGVNVDVIEVDAASNSGVDEIRQIREKAKFLPSGIKYKVYIIDEVHMLTTASFNALLKTLEEPPAHVVFILATTEPQRIPLTILSRCQRFEFKSLSMAEIQEQLLKVCKDQNVTITEEALIQIAEGSEGALRDALSTLDQAISYSNGEVNVDDVNVVLGSLSYDKLIDLGSSIGASDLNKTLDIVHDLLENGKEADKIIGGLLRFYRDMLLYKNVNDKSFNKYVFEKPMFQELANMTSEDLIYYYIELLSDTQAKIRRTPSPSLYLEVALIKLVNSSDMSLNYLQRINDLEQKVTSMEFPQDLGGEGLNGEDAQRLALNEDKVNRIITELNKLNLNHLTERVLSLESQVKINEEAESNTNEYVQDIDSIKEDVAIIKANLQSLKLQSNEDKAEFDTTEIDNKIAKLEQRLNAIPNINVAQINEDSVLIEELEKRVSALEAEPKQVVVESFTNSSEERKEDIKDNAFEDVSNPLEEKVEEVYIEEPESEEEAEETLVDNDEVIEESSKEVEGKVEEEYIEEPVEEEVIEEDSKEELEVRESPTGEYVDNPVIPENGMTMAQQLDANYKDTSSIEQSVEEVKEEDIVSSEEPKQKSLFDFTSEEVNAEKEIDEESEEEPVEVEDHSIRQNSVEDLLASESRAIDTESVERVIPTKVTPIDKYNSYDIRFVSEILRDSRTESAKQEKRNLENIWPVLANYPDPNYKGVVIALSKGMIAACGNHEFLIIFPTAVQCNQVMSLTFKQCAKEVLKSYLNYEPDYIALYSDLWLKIRHSYIEQYNQDKTKDPVLEPITDPSLFVVKPSQEFVDEKEKVANNLLDSFGDIVKIK